MVEERGRSTASRSLRNVKRSLSRSSSRNIKTDGESKPVHSSKIKKMMKGLSRKKSKKVDSDGMSTAVSVQAEEMSATTHTNPAKEVVPTPAPTEQPPAKALTLQLVLLLMDPATRRFELLQLEFDSDKARVSDIIAQIPISVTEAAIRNQQYEGVIDDSAKVMNEFVRLVEFCSGKTVLVALPKGLSVKECVRLARPILCDKQVERMLTAGKFDIAGWKKKGKDDVKKEAPVEEPRSVPTATTSPAVEKPKQTSVFPLIVIFAVLAIVVETAHTFLSSPIEVGTPLKPGTWKSKCGLLGLIPPLPFLEDLDFLPKCTDSFLEVHDDGTVTIKDAERELDILMKGGICSDEDCIEGLVLQEDGKVFIGGTQVKTAFVYGENISLSPWPFEEAPTKLKLKSSSRR